MQVVGVTMLIMATAATYLKSPLRANSHAAHAEEGNIELRPIANIQVGESS